MIRNAIYVGRLRSWLRAFAVFIHVEIVLMNKRKKRKYNTFSSRQAERLKKERKYGKQVSHKLEHEEPKK